MDEFNSVLEFIESLIELFETADGTFSSFSEIIVGIAVIFESILSIIGFLGSVVTIAIAIVSAIVTFIIWLVSYILTGASHYKIAKNAGCKQAWLVWIPFFQNLLCIFVLSRIPNNEGFAVFNGKFRTDQKNVVTLAYAIVYFFGSTIVTIIIALCNIIPAIGQVVGAVATLLYLLPAIFLGVIEYVYLRDTLNVFKEDEKNNRTHAFIITILDSLITSGWARVLYFFSMRKLKPLEKKEPVISDEVPALTE